MTVEKSDKLTNLLTVKTAKNKLNEVVEKEKWGEKV